MYFDIDSEINRILETYRTMTSFFKTIMLSESGFLEVPKSNFKYFNHKPIIFCGEPAILVTPNTLEVKWTIDTLKFRSSIWGGVNNEKCLSAGFPKFFNYGENPTLYPDPLIAKDLVIEEKIDGTCVICDWFNNQFNMRTRGTVDYKEQANASDFEVLPERYPKTVEWLKSNSKYSLLFELVTPNNVIVLKSSEITFTLIGCIDKSTYQSLTPSELDQLSLIIGVPRPHYYDLSTTSFFDFLKQVKEWKKREGVVLVYNKGQNRVKYKTDWYLFLHRIKSQFNSINSILEYYLKEGRPNFEAFYSHLVRVFDFEIAESLKPTLYELCSANQRVDSLILEITTFIDQKVRFLPTRKEQAQIITQHYQPPLTSLAFCILDKRPISQKSLLNLLQDQLNKK